jgi:hypothetical protein
MAFTGTPVVVKVSDRMFRITGVTLAGDASGTIGLLGKLTPAEVSLNAKGWGAYKNADGEAVTLIDAVSVVVGVTTDVTAAVPISVVKTGVDTDNFLITLHNDSAATVSASLEIYVEFH